MDTQPRLNTSCRIALEIEYDGSRFHGWQRQGCGGQLATVQASLEKALSSVADETVGIVCAGRTDSGVHATGQVVHFDVSKDRGEKAWVRGGNSQLPDAVRIRWARRVPDDFHARFSALARRYMYLFYEYPVAPALLASQLTHVTYPLDTDAMHQAGQFLLGERDFSSFRAAGCQSRSAHRFVHWLNVYRLQRFVVVDIKANAFLQHMVRNIAGMLLEVGRGERPPDWAQTLLQARDRRAGGVTAAPAGLYLVRVEYPPRFVLPASPLGPCFLPVLE